MGSLLAFPLPEAVQQPEIRSCDDCDQTTVRKSFEQQEFQYGAGKDAVLLTVSLPVWRCQACDSAYVEEEGEIIQHEAVCRHLGVLTPAEIRKLRGSRTRQEFGTLTGIGEASLKRWESGEVIQNEAMDMLLRVVDDPIGERCVNKIRQKKLSSKSQYAEPQFRTEIDEESRKYAKAFSLRKVG